MDSVYYDKSKIATYGETTASPPKNFGGTTDTPPTTWDELRKCARATTKPNADPQKAIYGIGDLPFLETLWSAGGEVCDATKCLLDSDASHEALDFIVSLRTDGLAHPRALANPSSGLDLFLTGRVAMTVASTEHLSYTRNARFPIGLAPVPGKNGPISQQSDNVLVVFTQHANAKRAAIAAVLDFLTGPAVQDHDAFQAGSAPTRRSLAKDAPIPEGLQAAFDNSRNTPLIPSWAAIAYELERGIGGCLAR
ncbi:MAG: extracellular solute-binding protein [Candidatus Hydrogenedentes bacterium]|nr:extracellular solute-binding protein [Candidatus Hydrogenedentota bacterium]